MSAASTRPKRQRRPLQEPHYSLDQIRERLIQHLLQVTGGRLSQEAAADILQQARVWAGQSARPAHAHLTAQPEALTAPTHDLPIPLLRLTRLMQKLGHGDVVTQLGCAICGNTERMLNRVTSQGRCCNWCAQRDELRPCARCERDGHIVTTRDDGPICRRCYERDPQRQHECGGCRRHIHPVVRLADGTPLCQSCAPRPQHRCVRCDARAPAHAQTDQGPVCRGCYEAPQRRCGQCGQIREISKRQTEDGEPDLCHSCYKGYLDECVICGRTRPGSRLNGEDFHCRSCRPRTRATCSDCGLMALVHARWPMGPVCPTCYSRRSRSPAPCANCSTLRVLVGRTEAGDICGPCSGVDIDFACRRCGYPGAIFADGCCARCVMRDRVHDLLSHADGQIATPLMPLAEALSGVENPHAVLNWLRRSGAARLLATLVTRSEPLSHDMLDELPQDHNLRYLREVLVATSVLPRRHETYARLQLWLRDFLQDLPRHQLRIIRPFAEWDILRGARRVVDRGRYTDSAAAGDRLDIRSAHEFLTWLDHHNLNLQMITQAHVDQWLNEATPTRRNHIRAFIRWSNARGLTTKLETPREQTQLAGQFLSESDQHDQLRRCLNDVDLPLEARIIGALVRLYALPLSRIVRLTTDQFHVDDDGAYLTFDRNPVLLPPKLGRLLEEHIAGSRAPSILRQAREEGDPIYLFPGQPPSRPRNPAAVTQLLNRHGLPSTVARNTAMIDLVACLPPVVISDLMGLAVSTTQKWANYAQDSWADYLAARQADE